MEPNVLNNFVFRLLPIPSTVSRTDCNPVFVGFDDGMLSQNDVLHLGFYGANKRLDYFSLEVQPQHLRRTIIQMFGVYHFS